MEVIRSNFNEKYDLIEKCIKEATFLAIDGEFTGLNEEFNLNLLDSPEDRYEKLKEGSMQFLMIQFGVCAFKYHPENEGYTYQPFNFYIFPKSVGKHDTRFFCQSSSLHFLASQGFNFNKLFLDGIPYLTAETEEQLREDLKTKHASLEQKLENSCTTPVDKSKKKGAPSTPGDKVQKEHKNFIDDTHAKVSEFNKSCKDGDKIELPPCSNYRRKLIYEMMETEFQDEKDFDIQTLVDDSNNRFIQITKTSLENKTKMLKERIQSDFDELDNDIGFSKIINIISQSRKLVIGHNMLLDIMHIVDQFHVSLPPTIKEFKQLVNDVLPNIIDTKVMATTKPFQEFFEFSSLNKVLQRTQEPPFVPVKVSEDSNFDGKYSMSDKKLHEAGYDAYITGLCFLNLTQHLTKLKPDFKSMELVDHPLIKPFLNKVFMMKSADIPYLNFSGGDLKPSRNHVFHVTFPKDFKTMDLVHHFSSYGPIFVSWINNETAFVSLKNVNQAENAMKLTKTSSGKVKVIRYDEFRNPMEKSSKKHKSESDANNPPPKKIQKLEDNNQTRDNKLFDENTDYN